MMIHIVLQKYRAMLQDYMVPGYEERRRKYWGKRLDFSNKIYYTTITTKNYINKIHLHVTTNNVVWEKKKNRLGNQMKSWGW